MLGSRAAIAVLALMLAWVAAPAWAQASPGDRRRDYQAVSAQLERHVVLEAWLDDDPESPGLLARQWSLSGEWVAAWLDAHPSAGPGGVRAALAELSPDGARDYLELSDDAVLVVAPGPIGNVFIVAQTEGRHRLAWSISQPQEAHGEPAEILAAWRPENARLGERGPYSTSSGSAGPVIPRIGRLPSDAKGHPRFYVDGAYAQGAGGTVGAQISLWTWDGTTARPLTARTYLFAVDQAVGTRVEGELLEVRRKDSFRAFFACGMCEERQLDWIVRLTGDGFEVVGERVIVPELDAVDELLARVIHHQDAAGLATPGAIGRARRLVGQARADFSEKEWKEFPTLGMMGGWTLRDEGAGKVLCLSLDEVGPSLFTFRRKGGKPLIADLRQAKQPCDEKR